MSALVSFESNSLPSFLKKAGLINNDLSQGVSLGGFPSLSIKGKVFTLVKGGERTVIMKPDEDDEVATSLEVVILRANPNLSKSFYRSGYEDGAAAKPDCASDDGKKPNSNIESPVCSTCAACPKNAWGSASNGGKGKACSDTRRIAVAPAGQLNDPMLLRVPPASLKPLAEFAEVCNKRGVPYNGVVCKLKFEREEATPKLIFQPFSFLSEAGFAQVEQVAASELVENIIGLHGGKQSALPAPAEEKKPEPKAEPKPEKKAEPKPEKKAEPKPEKKAEAPEESTDNLMSELDDLLGSSDD